MTGTLEKPAVVVVSAKGPVVEAMGASEASSSRASSCGRGASCASKLNRALSR